MSFARSFDRLEKLGTAVCVGLVFPLSDGGAGGKPEDAIVFIERATARLDCGSGSSSHVITCLPRTFFAYHRQLLRWLQLPSNQKSAMVLLQR